MFCKSKEIDNTSTLNCNVKMVSEIVSFISVIFSFLVILVTATKAKLNMINKFILQILISEILDGINILLVIIDDFQGHKIFENYNQKTYVCFTQIYISIFSCFWTLSASFFIALRMYDMMIKKNKIFKLKIFEKYASLISIFIPAVISYIFWLLQVIKQSQKYNELTSDSFYLRYHKHDHFRHMFCWADKKLNYIIFVFALLLIGANIYLSIKGSIFIKKMTAKSENYKQKQSDNMERIKRTLWVYPISSAIMWILFFILQIIFDNGTEQTNRDRNILLSLFYCLLISIRQMIYVVLFLITQKDIKKKFIGFILCKSKKRNKNTNKLINEINKENQILDN